MATQKISRDKQCAETPLRKNLMTTRRKFIQSTSATSILGLGFMPSFAQSRSDTVRLVIGFAPGGTADAIARRVADRLRGQLAANVVVENKVGAGGQIAITTVKDSPGDGSTILMTPSSCLSIYPFTYPNKQRYLNRSRPLTTLLRGPKSIHPKVPTARLRRDPCRT